MKKSLRCLLVIFTGLLIYSNTYAQYEGYVHEGEFGFQMGTAHYFGDLNTRSRINRPKIAAGIFFRKQINNYVALRIGTNFAQLGYSDRYETKNEFRRRRNLSFNTNIFELMVQGDFNFFRFNPTNPGERFTPYLTFGAGIFTYDPYAFLNDKKYFLRPLGTEGQGSPLFPGSKQYSTTALAFPVGLGIKLSLNGNINLHLEISHRFTNTDFIDDISATYAGPEAFKPGSPAALLQDRSYETGPLIGLRGQQRGFSSQKDQYITAMVGVTFNFSSYRCPSSQ